MKLNLVQSVLEVLENNKLELMLSLKKVVFILWLKIQYYNNFFSTKN